jgi:hypothetical protein
LARSRSSHVFGALVATCEGHHGAREFRTPRRCQRLVAQLQQAQPPGQRALDAQQFGFDAVLLGVAQRIQGGSASACRIGPLAGRIGATAGRRARFQPGEGAVLDRCDRARATRECGRSAGGRWRADR